MSTKSMTIENNAVETASSPRLREIRKLTDDVLRSLNAEFDALYSDQGRPSIAPEYVLRALLLQVFFSVRSERQLVEQINYNLLFRWFVGLGMDDAMWNHAVFSKNRDRLLTSEMAQRFFAEVNRRAERFHVGLRHRPEPSLAGREGLQLAQTDRPAAPGKAARSA
jgi:transposase